MKGFIEITALTRGVAIDALDTLVAISRIVAVTSVGELTEANRAAAGLNPETATLIKVEGVEEPVQTGIAYETVFDMIQESI